MIQIKPAAAQRLRSKACAASMRTMSWFSRSVRRFVAGAAAVFFLACQGTAIVYAHSSGAPESGAAQGSCHDPAPQTGDTTYKNTCQANCQSQLTSSSPFVANISTAADLPAIAARIDRIVVVVDSPRPADPLLWVEPPPLAILHCCLRN